MRIYDCGLSISIGSSMHGMISLGDFLRIKPSRGVQCNFIIQGGLVIRSSRGLCLRVTEHIIRSYTRQMSFVSWDARILLLNRRFLSHVIIRGSVEIAVGPSEELLFVERLTNFRVLYIEFCL